MCLPSGCAASGRRAVQGGRSAALQSGALPRRVQTAAARGSPMGFGGGQGSLMQPACPRCLLCARPALLTRWGQPKRAWWSRGCMGPGLARVAPLPRTAARALGLFGRGVTEGVIQAEQTAREKPCGPARHTPCWILVLCREPWCSHGDSHLVTRYSFQDHPEVAADGIGCPFSGVGCSFKVSIWV